MYPIDTFCRNKMLYTRIAKINMYETELRKLFI